MAFARAQAQATGLECYQSLAQIYGSRGNTLPVPLMNILNGGKHAENGLAIQEFMIVPTGFSKFSEALRAGAEVFHYLKKILHTRGLATGVGDEGGFAPVFSGAQIHDQAIASILDAVDAAGYKAGKDIFLAIDCASSEFIDHQASSENQVVYQFEGKKLSSSEMTSVYERWCQDYPVISIEDGLSEHDWTGWKEITTRLGSRCQLVGDDLFVTNRKYLKHGIEQKAANAILIKLNQIGTVTETLETIKLASQSGYASITSHRSGESEDTFIADLAVATDCGQIKTGSASRTDRIAKYNQLLRIEELLGSDAKFAGKHAFKLRS
jgi:enolase